MKTKTFKLRSWFFIKMPITREISCIVDFTFSLPMRAIFSGSSQSGKTFMIGQILKHQNEIFNAHFEFVKYYYPTFLDEAPVEYHEFIDTPISYTECRALFLIFMINQKTKS